MLTDSSLFNLNAFVDFTSPTFILNMVFVAFFVFALFGFFYGLMFGVYNALFSTALKAITIVILIFLTPTIAKAIGNIDLTRFNVPSQITVGGSTISVSTITNTLVNYLNSTGIISPINGMSMYETLLVIANQLISFVTFFGLMLIIFLLSDLINGIIYSFTLRFAVKAHDKKKIKKFIEKNVEYNSTEELSKKQIKKIKHTGMRKLTGGLVSFVSTFLCFSITLAPLTSLGNTVSRATKELTQEEVDKLNNNTVNMIYKFSKEADQSLLLQFYKIFGNFDSKMMSAVTTDKINGVSFSLLASIQQLTDLLSPLLNSLADETTTSALSIFDLTKIIQNNVVEQCLDVLSRNNIIIILLPMLLNLGLNYADTSGVIDSSELDFSNINYKDEITLISDIYVKFKDAGLVSSLLSDFSNVKLDFTKKSDYLEAISRLGESNILTNNLAYLFTKIGKVVNEQAGVEIFSLDVEDYKNINWANELCILFSIVFDLLEEFGMDTLSAESFTSLMDEIINTLMPSESNNNTSTDTTPGTSANLKIKAKGQNLDIVKLAATTTETEEEKRDRYIKALTIALIGDETHGKLGLLDLDLLNSGVDVASLITHFLSSNAQVSQFVSQDALDNLKKELSYSENLKSEIKSLLDVLPEISSIISSFDISLEADRQKLSDLLSKVETSIILNNVLPNVIKSMLQNTVGELFNGISVNNMKFTKDNLIKDIKSLLNIYDDINTLMNQLNNSSGSITDQIKNIDLDNLNNVLTEIINNNIINPGQILDKSGKVYDDYNINTIIKQFLNSDNMKNMGIVVPDNLYDIRWSVDTGNELTNFINVIKFLQNNIDVLFKDGSLTFNNIDGKLISEMFTTFSTSELFRPSLSSILDKSLTNILKSVGMNVSFFDLSRDEFIKLGDGLGQMIDSLKAIDGVDLSNSETLSNIDYANVDPIILNSILTGLYNSNLLLTKKDMGNYYIDEFGEFIYHISDNDAIKSLTGGNINKDKLSSVTKDGNVRFSWSESTETCNLKDANPSLTEDRFVKITKTGEIYSFVNILAKVQEVSVEIPQEDGSNQVVTGADALSSGYASKKDLQPVMYALLDSYTMESCAVSTINAFLGDLSMNIGSNSLKFSFMNVEAFNNYDSSETGKNKKKEEIDALLSLYDFIRSRDLTEEEKQHYVDLGKTAPTSTSDMNEIFLNLTKLTNTQLTNLREFMTIISSSEVMNSPKFASSMSFVEQLMSYALSYTGLDKIISNKADETEARLTCENIVKSVADWVDCNDKFVDIIVVVQGLDSIDNLSNPTSLLKVNSSTGDRYLISILHAINNCELTHRAVSSLFNKIFIEQLNMNGDIETYLTYRSSSVSKKVSFDIHIDYSNPSLTFWDEEITNLGNSLDQILGTSDNFNIVDKIKESKELKPIISLFGTLKTMRYVREYYIASILYLLDETNNNAILVGMFDGISGVVSPVFTKYSASGEEDYAYSIKVNFFRYSSLGYSEEEVNKLDNYLKNF